MPDAKSESWRARGRRVEAREYVEVSVKLTDKLYKIMLVGMNSDSLTSNADVILIQYRTR